MNKLNDNCILEQSCKDCSERFVCGTGIPTVIADGYTLIAAARGERVLLFEKFGSYQGTWLMVSYKSGNYYIYKDFYGSCSGCDALESEDFDYMKEYNISDPKIVAFINKYQPVVVLPAVVARNLAHKHDIISILPRNIRDEFEFEDMTLSKFAEMLEGIIIKDE